MHSKAVNASSAKPLLKSLHYGAVVIDNPIPSYLSKTPLHNSNCLSWGFGRLVGLGLVGWPEWSGRVCAVLYSILYLLHAVLCTLGESPRVVWETPPEWSDPTSLKKI